VVQLTDIHLFATPDQSLMGITTRASLLPIVEQIAQLQPSPDVLLLTGDLSQDGSPESYEQIINLLSPLNLPIYWLPGNHDCFEVMARSLAVPPFLADKSFVQSGWRFLLLNSQVPGEVQGYLSLASLDWLKDELTAHPELPTTIAFHHPPLSLNTKWLDSSALQNPDDLFQIVDRHPQVKLVLFGHIHQEVEQVRSSVTYLGCPSTCFQFARDHQTFTLDDRYPGFRILDLAADGSWSSEVRRVDCHMTAIATPKGY
jgi:3',5'-cyclic-AMP phosphodiesterase